MNIPNLTYKNNLLISAPKIDTDLLWNLSMLFVGFATVYFIGVFFFRNRLSSSSKKVRDRKRELSPMISEFLFLEEDASKDEKANYIALKVEIRQLLKDPFNRRVLSEVLLDLRKDISGEAQLSLFKLYQDLGLHKDAYAKLKGWRWQVISKGIRELTQMEVAESYSFITKFINDKRATIRKQAEIATVTLRHEGINYFLDTTKYRISEWQQLKLLDVIRNKKDFQPPRFKAWLTSNNKYVVLFALRLIKYYNQNDADASLIELVKHRNNQIKEEAIACIKEFNVTGALDMLKLVFWNCSTTVKISILDAIAHIGSQADIEFLRLIDKKELNFSVKSKALSSINSISPQSIMPSKGIQDESRYRIPDDITEAVAKMHAAKHAEISGENDGEFTEREIIEEKVSSSDSNVNTKNQKTNESGVANVNLQVTSIGERDLDISLNEETRSFDDILNIEVQLDREVEEEFIDRKIHDNKGKENHLDFLPIVVINEESENDYTDDSINKSPMKELDDIDVIYDEFLSEENHEDVEVPGRNQEKSSFFEEFRSDELGFLPIVVDNEFEIEDQPAEQPVNANFDIGEIRVRYTEIEVKVEEEDNNVEEITTDLVLNTAPLHELKNIDLSEVMGNDSGFGFARYETAEIRNTAVVYDEISERIHEIQIPEIEVVEPYLFQTPNKFEQSSEVHSYDEDDSMDEIDLSVENEKLLQKIIDDLVSFDEPPRVENTIDDSFVNPDWDLDESELDFIPVSFEKEERQTPSFIKIEKPGSDLDDEDMNIPKASIPSPIFGDIEFEANTRQLLNDLEHMGDQREIPFLKELLDHQKYEIFKDRINHLIDTFNHTLNKSKIDSSIQPFSVFQDLFRTCDDEAKLILLNEVVEVGDEKEIHFLKQLLNDDSPEIRKKATKVLKELQFKLFGEEEATHHNVSKTLQTSESIEKSDLEDENDAFDMFDLNFDITESLDNHEDEKKNDKTQNTVQYGSFFGQISSFSNKIMEKLNG